MSVKVMQWVWDHAADVRGNDLLVLLALADWANEAGRCWPSVARLAAKARVGERTAQYSVRRLAARGYVGVERGGGRRYANHYTVRMLHPSGPERAQPAHRSCGATGGTNGADAPPNGAPASAPEPSPEPPPEPSGLVGDGFAVRGSKFEEEIPTHHVFREPCLPRTPNPSPVPSSFPLGAPEYAFAAALGLGQAAAEHETAKFLDHYRARAARFADWPAAWRKWMRHADAFAHPSPHRHISHEMVADEDASAALEPTPGEQAWRAVLTARAGWVAGSPAPALDAVTAGAVALLGGWAAVADGGVTWPRFLAAFNRARDDE